MNYYFAGAEAKYVYLMLKDAGVKKALFSFYGMSNKVKRNFWSLSKIFTHIMIDSGAFTFITGNKKVKENEIDDLVIEYGNWLKSNKDYFNHYVEMDVDSVLGYPKVLEYRKYLEDCTGIPCMPCWHIMRGVENWRELSKQYQYIALGGLANRELRKPERYIPTLLSMAHQNNCKVHGMGYTKFQYLKTYPFDSVDSTSWLKQSIYGGYYVFVDNRMEKAKGGGLKNLGRLSKIHYSLIKKHNLKQFKAYADYLEKYWENKTIVLGK